MSKLQTEAQQRLDLLAYLEELLGCVKSLHAGVGAVVADVAAIRNTVSKDPEDIALFKANLKLATGTARLLVDEAICSYDDLVEELKRSKPYTN